MLFFPHELQMLHLKRNTFILLSCNLVLLFKISIETINTNTVV